MTYTEIEYVLKRMPYIEKAIKNKQSSICFYVGHRREEIVLNEQICTISLILKDICEKENDLVKYIINQAIKGGKSDCWLIIRLPMSKNYYYRIKQELYQRIFLCCVEKKIMNYGEIMSKRIE